MEFFKIVDLETNQDQIKKGINFDNLNDLCESIFILDYKDNIAEIGSMWGEFSLQKDIMNGGLRFSLLECPNALAFTITTGFPPEPKKIVIHLTVNRLELKLEFIEEIEALLSDWEIGLLKNYKK